MENKISKKAQEDIAQLQLFQQRIQVLSSQKQQFQLQLIEIENALTELKKAKSPTFILVGGLLVEKNKATINKDLEAKKKDMDLRIKSYESQEKKTKDKSKELQEQLAKVLK